MKMKRILSLVLSLVMAFSVLLPGTQAKAAGDGQTRATEKDGMVLTKNSVANQDGSYTITLEAFATGHSIVVPGGAAPADIVLVLDQSGSMKNNFTAVTPASYEAYPANTTNSSHWDNRENDGGRNLHHRLAEGTYVPVYMDRTATEAGKIPANQETNSRYYSQYNNGAGTQYYAKIGGQYYPVSIDRGNWSLLGREYTYTANGQTIATSRGDNTTPSFSTDDGILHMDGQDYSYEYYYMLNGQKQPIDSSNGNNGTIHTTLYRLNQPTSSTISRLRALKDAVTIFANQVAENSKGKDGVAGTTDDLHHRVAIVGFGAEKDSNPGNYRNSELFIGSDSYTYGDAARAQYGNAFQDMSTSSGKDNITASIGALDADGGTYVHLGMEMANGILSRYPIGQDEKRNRVIVVFTDGSPGSGSWSTTDMSHANNAIGLANTARDTYKADVYTVGIFDGANASSAGSSTGNSNEKSNWFMQNLSSNKGVVSNPSYYLSASDSDKLNSVFKQIGDNVSSGADNEALSAETTIADFVSPYFALPVNNNGQATTDSIGLTFETYKYLGGDQTSPNSWREDNSMTTGVTGEITSRSGNNAPSVKVNGFDFAENYVGMIREDTSGNTTARGYKLVIKFNVMPRPGFLGGNGVPTNTDRSGVYAKKDAENPMMTFDVPKVEVPIGEITVDAKDKNVYLLNSLTEEESHHDVVVNVRDSHGFDQKLYCDRNNFGLQTWQNEFVNISIVYKNGNDDSEILEHLPVLNDLEEDQVYRIGVLVEPKEPGNVEEKVAGDEVRVNVFMPTYTHSDGEVYYGDEAPVVLVVFIEPVVWKHGDTIATRDIMIGSEPSFYRDYSIDTSMLDNGKVKTKKDVPVSLTVKKGDRDITEFITFEHEDCEGNLDDGLTFNKECVFVLHVNTCDLTITKAGNVDDDPFVFTIQMMNDKGVWYDYTQLSIIGNGSEKIKELPVGTYRIVEAQDWSWRYRPSIDKVQVELSATNSSDGITCTNTKDDDHWLNDFSTVVKNTYGAKGPTND